MVAQSSSSSPCLPIICASFNQDYSCFALGTRDGFRIFETISGRLRYERVIGAFSIVEMLFRSSLLAIVGAGEQPSLCPRRLCLFNTTTGTALRELNFLTSILVVRMNKQRGYCMGINTYAYEWQLLWVLFNQVHCTRCCITRQSICV